VLAWLHPEDETIERGMHYLDQLSRRLMANMTDSGTIPDITSLYAGEKGMDRKLADVATFFQLPYFRRLWRLPMR
jgi:hypothetical protein